MSDDPKPWEIEPALTAERLLWIARRFREVRAEALETHRPSLGDARWGFGCKCYERQMFSLVTAANSREVPWLTIQNATKKFVFRIGGVPMRFYKGEPESPRENLRQTFDELRQRPLALGTNMLLPSIGAAGLAWCIAVETDGVGLVSRVTVAAFSGQEDDLIVSYEIPLDAAAAAPIIRFPAPAAVPIAPPLVSAPVEKKKVSDDDGSEGNK